MKLAALCWQLFYIIRSLAFGLSIAILCGWLAIPYASAQNVYTFKSESLLKFSMLKMAAITASGIKTPDPCRLDIITINGSGEYFTVKNLSSMNKYLAEAIVGYERTEKCQINTHELSRNDATDLYAHIKSQEQKAYILEVIYIPIADHVVAYTGLHNEMGQTIGKSGSFPLPVTRSNRTLTTASINIAAEQSPAASAKSEGKPPPKEKTKLLTEVHFDSGSANITYVGKQKIRQAVEAIKKQNPRMVRILGFTDSRGDAKVNKTVATVRAQNVARMLREAGVNIRLEVEGRGEKGGPYKIPDGVSEPLNRCVGIIAVGIKKAEKAER